MQSNQISKEEADNIHKNEVQESLKHYVSIPKQRFREMDYLIQTYEMMRDELVEMGLLEQNIAPMFFTESIASNVKKLRDEAWVEGAQIRTEANKTIRLKLSKVAFGYDSTPWKHNPEWAHVADMVAVAIGNNILDAEV